MLSAILHGKKTGSGLAGRQFKIGETQGAEDLLTATIFERISYLPNNTFQEVIKKLFDDKEDIGNLQNIEYWPKWMNKNRFIEPDVVLTGTNGKNIIIEAKRYDNTQQQYAIQLANEIMSYYDSTGLSNPILLAIGGMDSYDKKRVEKIKKEIKNILIQNSFNREFTLYCISWKKLYQILESSIHQSEIFLQRILSDIREAYIWHGVRYKSIQWLKSLKRNDIIHISIPIKIRIEKKWIELKKMNISKTHLPSFLGE
ncbi:TPA: hypothetical protein ACPD3N_000642 [Pasteurella multocida]